MKANKLEEYKNENSIIIDNLNRRGYFISVVKLINKLKSKIFWLNLQVD
jgi:hypothetical protein